MKAKVRATGEIVEVHYSAADNFDYEEFEFPHPRRWKAEELLTPEDRHWENIRERAAIAALYGSASRNYSYGECVEFAINCADAIVEELKKKQQ